MDTPNAATNGTSTDERKAALEARALRRLAASNRLASAVRTDNEAKAARSEAFGNILDSRKLSGKDRAKARTGLARQDRAERLASVSGVSCPLVLTPDDKGRCEVFATVEGTDEQGNPVRMIVKGRLTIQDSVKLSAESALRAFERD